MNGTSTIGGQNNSNSNTSNLINTGMGANINSNSMKNIRLNADISKDLSSKSYVRPQLNHLEAKPLNVMLCNMLKSVGIDMLTPPSPLIKKTNSTLKSSLSQSGFHQNAGDGTDFYNDPFPGTIMLSSAIAPAGSGEPDAIRAAKSRNENHSREAMLLRMEKIFDEVEERLNKIPTTEYTATSMNENEFDTENDIKINRSRLHVSKPVVVGDAIPPPTNSPPLVGQVLILL